jgi:hypothetical protein
MLLRDAGAECGPIAGEVLPVLLIQQSFTLAVRGLAN